LRPGATVGPESVLRPFVYVPLMGVRKWGQLTPLEKWMKN